MSSTNAPRADSEQTLNATQDHTTAELRALLDSLFTAYVEDIEAVAEQTKPCACCATRHYEAFIRRERLDRALLDLSESVARDEVVAGGE